MSLRAEVLEALVASGATAEMIIAAVRADASIEEAKAADRRAKAAERQRALRSRNVMSRSEDVTVRDTALQSVTSRDTHNGARPVRSIAHQAALDMWNEMAARTGLPKALTATGKRQAMLRQRLSEHGADAFQRAVEAVERSKFCQGENERGWRADIGFMLRPDNFVKLLEGGYGPITKPEKPRPPQTAADLRRGIAYAEDHDDPERAEALRVQLAEMLSRDPNVSGVIAQAAQSLRVISR